MKIGIQYKIVPGHRRNDVWTPVFTGVTVWGFFYESINYNTNLEKGYILS
jgi:hypothetical protein